MKMKLLNKGFAKNCLAFSLIISLLMTSYLPFVSTPFSPAVVSAQGSTCSSSSTSKKILAKRPTPRVGGVALDQAATFLADMSEVTGAYYDANLDRIVFVGKTNTSAPKLDRDDLAVAIKAILFNGELPWVSLEGTNPDPAYVDAVYSPGIENTKFGDILIKADIKLKNYDLGKKDTGEDIISNVPGYKSSTERYFTHPAFDPRSVNNYDNVSRMWITPQIITLKKDDTASAFVFENTKMEINEEAMGTNDPLWNQVSHEQAVHFTQNYDLFAQEIPEWAEAKRLGQIAAVVKWINDSGISTDFYWARDYEPKRVITPKSHKKVKSKEYTFQYEEGEFIVTSKQWIEGGATLFTNNTYTQDTTGQSSGIKNSAQAVQTTKEDLNWTFTKDGQQYNAVAVAADAFRSLGSYNTAETDMAFQTTGDQTLAFHRAYSSFSGGQRGVGRGWNMYPAMMFDNKPAYPATTFVCNGIPYPKQLAFITQTGGFESFTINNCTTGYVPDDPAYHSKLVRNADGTFTVTLKDQSQLNFDSTYKLRNTKDNNGNTIIYNYDASDKLTNITDSKGHQITINYTPVNGIQLISSITDWSGRTVRYTYDDQGSLLTVTDPNGGITKYTYDSNFKLTSITDKENNVITTNTYTPEAKIATQKNAANITTTHTYDEINRLIGITNNQTPSRTYKTKYDAKGRILEETDPLVQSIVYTYGTEFSPLTIKDKRGNTITNTYDVNGNITSVTFPDTKKITYEYDTKNRLTRTLDYRYGTTSKETKYIYNTPGDLTQLNEAGLLTNYTYDASGEMLTLTDPISHKTTWTRDTFGNPLTEVDGLNNSTSYEYDQIGRLKKKTDSDNKILSYTYDANGNVLTQTDAAGTTTNVYDKENNLIKVTKPNNAVTQYAYNASDTITSVTDAMNNQTTYGYDAYQNMLTQQNALNQTTTYAYDQLNRQTQSTTPLGKATKWEYDANGNITKRIDAKNNAIMYTYDSFNRLTKITYPDAKTTTFEYDNRGNRTKMIDAIGTSTYTYDNFDRLTKAIDAFNQTISYTYDNADNVTKITYPGGKSVSYTYDNNDRLTKVTDWNLKATNYTYNKNGTLATRTLPNGITSAYTYDAANRQIGVKHTKSTTTLANFTYERDAVGNITKASEQGTYLIPVAPTQTPTLTPTSGPTPTTGPTATPTPTPAGGSPDLVITNVTFTPTNPQPNQFFTATTTIKNQGTGRAYAPASRIAYYYDNPSAPTYQTTYNDFNNITIDLQPGATMTVTNSYLYFDTTGNHHFYVMIDQNQSITESNENNNLNGPVNVTLASATPLSQMFAFLNSFKIQEASAQTAPYVTNYTYDPLGRLTTAKYPENKQYTYTYDKADNRLSETVNSNTKNYTYNADNELQQGGELTYYYDNNGNQIQKTQTGLLQNHRYSYNHDNKLTQYIMPNGNTHNYRYDGLGNRLEKEFSTAISRWVYDNSGDLSKLLATSAGDKYVYGIGLISQGGDSNSTRQYLLEDGLGNTRFISDYNGNKKKALEYEPYGKIRRSDGSTDTAFQFQGQQYDDIQNMYYMRARMYDQETGRFISQDPITGVKTMPQSYNPYAYALNNPIVHNDPSGKIAPIVVLAAIGAVAGGVSTYIANPDATVEEIALGAAIGAGSAALGVGAGAVAGKLLTSTAMSAGARQIVSSGVSNALEGGVSGGINSWREGNNVNNIINDASADALFGFGTGNMASAAIRLRGRHPNELSLLKDGYQGKNTTRIYAQQALSEGGGAGWSAAKECLR